jgi:bleomycin hydrolase
MKKLLFSVFWVGSIILLAQPTRDFEMEILLPCTNVKDQAYSGTCWSFATCSFIESELIRKNKKNEANISEMFIARWAYLMKLEKYLASRGTTFFTAGGQPHDVMNVIRQKGLMPAEQYRGNALYPTHYHPPLDTLMMSFAKSLLHSGKTTLNESDKKFAQTILNTFLGNPPDEFSYQGKDYTSQSYAQNLLEINPDDYVEITSLQNKPFYQQIVLEDKYNWSGDKYFNVPLEDFVLITNEAIRKGFTVVWNGDSVEPTFQAERGLAYLPPETKVSQESRQIEIDNKNTQIEHVMHIVGIAREKGTANAKKDKKSKKDLRKIWYYVKNSWGEISPFRGFLYMSEDYFKMKTIAIMLHKEAIPAEIRKKLKM